MAKKKRIFWTDKKGNKYTFREFMAKWKEGIQNISPLQQTNIKLRSTWLTAIGILCGLIVSFFAVKTLWWLSIILLGALINTAIIIVGMYQTKWSFEKVESIMKDREVKFNDEQKRIS